MKEKYLAPDLSVAEIETTKIVCDSNPESRVTTSNYTTGILDEED